MLMSTEDVTTRLTAAAAKANGNAQAALEARKAEISAHRERERRYDPASL